MAEKEYIEREALLNEIKETRPLNWTDAEAEITEQADYDIFENLVKSQPIADVQEVRHGKWEEQLDGTHYCSHCGRDATYNFDGKEVCGNVCTYCGTIMDKE